MAKKDKKAFRIPKKVGGVKVPKEARRAGEALLEKASSPEGRQAIASGLAMAASAAAAVAARQARGPASAAEPVAGKPGDPGIHDLHRAGEAINKAVETMVERFFAPRK